MKRATEDAKLAAYSLELKRQALINSFKTISVKHTETQLGDLTKENVPMEEVFS